MHDERLELRGRTLDGAYRLGRVVGVGGTGIVFESTELASGRACVVKVLRPQFVGNADLERRLRREAEVWERVRHPGLVPIYGSGTLADGSPYLVMEYLRGESLLRYVRRRGCLAPEEAAVMLLRLAGVLHAVHQLGYVHRDIKPEHILLDRDAEGALRVLLLDFGVCAAESAPTGERERERGRVYGTPSYVSPEQASGQPYVDGRADLFCLGTTIFECTAGALPFSGSTVSNLLRRILLEDAPRMTSLRPGLPAYLDDVVASIMRRDPSARPATARAVGRALLEHVTDRAGAERRLAALLHLGGTDVESVPTRRVEAA